MSEKIAEKTYKNKLYLLHHDDKHGYLISIINSIGIMVECLYFKTLEIAQEWFDGIGKKNDE